MNRISRLVGIVACAALPTLAQAQTSTARPVSFGIMGGASVPVGDFGDGADVGFTLGAHLMLAPATTSALAFRIDGTYDRWNSKTVSNVNSTTMGLMGNVIVRSTSTMVVRPYGIAGVGLLSTKGSEYSVTIGGVTTTIASERSNNLGAQIGGGLEFQLSGFTTFVEAKYVNAFAKNSNDERVNRGNIPITFGIRF